MTQSGPLAGKATGLGSAVGALQGEWPVNGVVRFVQVDEAKSLVEATVTGITPGNIQVHNESVQQICQ